MKKNSLIVLVLVLFLSIFIITGCSSKEKDNIISKNQKVNTSKMQHKHCTREASAGTGIIVSLNYDLYYTGDDLNILHSVEKVVATKDSDLDTYENAYKGIYKNYDGLEYYDANVIRGDTTVTSDVTINYEKIDVNKLLSIEGEEDNIIENGKAKVNKWITLAKKFGTKCEDVED